MKKYQIGLVGLGLFLVGGLVGNLLIPKVVSLGGVSYDKTYAYDLDVSNNATLKNATISGTTSLTGASTLASATVTGATVLNGGLTMDTNKFTVADTTGNTSIGGTLGVTGTTTINSNATVKCPIFYDGVTTSVAYYSYVSGGNVIATTTKPALCN